jgi:hypothetical protein
MNDAKPSSEIRVAEPDDIDELRHHCRAFLNAERQSHQISMARSKLDEFIYWLRAHRAREAREQ